MWGAVGSTEDKTEKTPLREQCLGMELWIWSSTGKVLKGNEDKQGHLKEESVQAVRRQIEGLLNVGLPRNLRNWEKMGLGAGSSVLTQLGLSSLSPVDTS